MKSHLLLVALVVFSLSGCNQYESHRIETTSIRIDSLNQIILLSDSLVLPNLYTNISGLDSLPTPKAKVTFISAVLPSILVARYHVEETKQRLHYLKEKNIWNKSDSLFYENLKIRYKATSMDDLDKRLITLPNSIVLAQAAVESGWGQSRFFLEGSNLFGMWSFSRNEPRLVAAKTRDKKSIYLRSYNDMSESITHYFETLGKAKPYHTLRLACQTTNNPYRLLKHLNKFSERGKAYTRQLKRVIEINNLTKYDHYQINPEYIETLND